jgi:8-oxo-dGTP pyrophosphatase MutT (NUDIX family)
MLLYPDEEQQLHLILTLRTQTINHPGQISLPGGRAESGETAVETAMRETEEEIGLETGNIKIAGKLSDLYVQVSDNCVTPIVGFLDYSPEMKINPGEVKEAFSISLEALLDEKNLTVETWQLHNRDVHVPFWNIHSVPLWGATAMILSELLELYRGFKM